MPKEILDICLTKHELIEITHKQRPKAQAIALALMNIPFRLRPDGSILVSRLAFENALGGAIKNIYRNLPEIKHNFDAINKE